jgi:hypothetical protein
MINRRNPPPVRATPCCPTGQRGGAAPTMKSFLTPGATDNQPIRDPRQSCPDPLADARFGSDRRGLGFGKPHMQVAA